MNDVASRHVLRRGRLFSRPRKSMWAVPLYILTAFSKSHWNELVSEHIARKSSWLGMSTEKRSTVSRRCLGRIGAAAFVDSGQQHNRVSLNSDCVCHSWRDMKFFSINYQFIICPTLLFESWPTINEATNQLSDEKPTTLGVSLETNFRLCFRRFRLSLLAPFAIAPGFPGCTSKGKDVFQCGQ